MNQSDDENDKARDGSLHSKLPPITKPHIKPKVKNPYGKKKLYDDYIVVGKKALNWLLDKSNLFIKKIITI